MTKGQRRLAAIVLALLGIYGTMAAVEDRAVMTGQMPFQSETAVEETVDAK